MADEVEAGHEKMSGRHFVGAPATFLILVGNAYDFVVSTLKNQDYVSDLENAAEPVPTGLKSESIRKLAGRDVASGKDGLPSGSTSSSCSSRDATSNTKGEGDAYVSDVSNGNTGSQNGKYGSSSTFAKSNGFNSMKSNGNIGGKSSKSTNTQAIRPLNKASTLNGNKKLDAAFREAEQRSGGTGTKCPIFLFFSVNGSGQFVGIAEMVGQVDFDKDMDFWQLDKWNDWSIGLEQGLEMLNIFKSYSAKTSLLDDFNFYENPEKSLHTKKSNKPATLRMEIHENGDFLKHTKAGDRKCDDDLRIKKATNPMTYQSNKESLSPRLQSKE
ncbi:hypothetical protein GH714_021859 [Hevea brasiliensis]|uniref:YTH domain-containing family protein n=1 Tax=Hevea brasiliensis TaxID=3981 RepID=A0A6A6N634_HEVBR|nr:hypothetical protein GH714_021859 [Hevea brasiliensis]